MEKKVKEEKIIVAEGYLKELFSLIRKMETLAISDHKTRFNSTELRMLSEIVSAKYMGKRMISTQLAKSLKVTRSAISQMVKRLEKQNIVKRVPDDLDRKIAYIELTDEAQASYHADLERCVNFVERIVEKFGVERFNEMTALMNEFYALTIEEKA